MPNPTYICLSLTRSFPKGNGIQSMDTARQMVHLGIDSDLTDTTFYVRTDHAAMLYLNTVCEVSYCQANHGRVFRFLSITAQKLKFVSEATLCLTTTTYYIFLSLCVILYKYITAFCFISTYISYIYIPLYPPASLLPSYIFLITLPPIHFFIYMFLPQSLPSRTRH